MLQYYRGSTVTRGLVPWQTRLRLTQLAVVRYWLRASGQFFNLLPKYSAQGIRVKREGGDCAPVCLLVLTILDTLPSVAYIPVG